MTNILTAAEAANCLRCDPTDAAMLDLMPQVDSYIINATGHDWTADTAISPVAKAAARMVLVMWHEDPGMMAHQITALSFGIHSMLVQLEALARRYRNFAGRCGPGGLDLIGVRAGDKVSTLIDLTGATGDQSALFEAMITVDDQIQQLSGLDLHLVWYRAYLVSTEAM